MSGLSATEVHDRLDHPVIDIDGHTVEFFPALVDELVKEGVALDGESMLRRTSGTFGPIVDWYDAHARGAGGGRVARGPWGNGGMELAVDLRHRAAPPPAATSASTSSASTSA